MFPGLASVTFRQLAPADVVMLARDAGLRGIEWAGDVHVRPGDLAGARAVRNLTEQAQLAVVSYGSYYRAGHDPLESFDPVLSTARALGAPNIRVWAGATGSLAATAETRRRVAAELQRVCTVAAGEGLTVSVEFHAETLTDTAESTQQLLDEAAHANLFTYWQPIHCEPTPLAAAGLKTLLPRLKHVHVFHWWPGPEARFPLADGAARWREFLRIAKSAPGERFALLEFVAGNDPAQFRRDAAELRRLLASV